MQIQNKHILLVIRFLVGIVFVFSAVSKLIGIDSFEVYVYTLGWLPLELAFLLARIVISLELFIGVLFLLGKYLRPLCYFTLGVLGSFSIFIAYLMLAGNNESCHCFGEIVNVSHPMSLLKNLVLMVLVFAVRRSPQFAFRFDKALIILSLFAAFAIPVLVSPPDFFSYSKYAARLNYNQTLMNTFLQKNKQYAQGKRILCFYGTSCRFCKLSAKKMSVIVSKLSLSKQCDYVLWGDKDSAARFFELTHSTVFPHKFLEVNAFLKLTDGQMPLVLLLENGKVHSAFGYRDLDEKKIIDFFSAP